jgi:hypothetical protein
MANPRYIAAANVFLTMARVLADSKDDLEWVLTTIHHAHTLGPVLDPTAYRDGMQNLQDQEELFRPLFEAARTIAPVIARHEAARRIG